MTEETTTNLEDALTTPEQQPEPVEAQPEPAPEPVEAEETPKAQVNEDGGITVPLKALHEVRDANKALKMEMEALKAANQPAPEPLTAPDPIDDPEGFAAYTQKLVQMNVGQVQRQFQTKLLDMSEANAVKNHGADAVGAVKDWFASQPASFQQEVQQQADPYEYAINHHKQETMTAKLTADPAKLEQLLKLLEGGEKQPEPKAPGTTVTHQSVGARRGPEWSGPTPLDQIL